MTVFETSRREPRNSVETVRRVISIKGSKSFSWCTRGTRHDPSSETSDYAGSMERFARWGVYVISTIMSNICAILPARSRPCCSRDNGYAFFLPLTHPPSSRVATGNPVVFTLQPPECYMEIRYGYGTTGTRVAGPVRVGDPLTLIIYMRSKYGKPSYAQLNCSFAT